MFWTFLIGGFLGLIVFPPIGIGLSAQRLSEFTTYARLSMISALFSMPITPLSSAI